MTYILNQLEKLEKDKAIKSDIQAEISDHNKSSLSHEDLYSRMQAIELNFDGKLEVDRVIAGTNIVVDYIDNSVIISANINCDEENNAIQLHNHDEDPFAHADIRRAIPNKISQLENDVGLILSNNITNLNTLDFYDNGFAINGELFFKWVEDGLQMQNGKIITIKNHASSVPL